MMKIAAASGAIGFAGRLGAANGLSAVASPAAVLQDAKQGGTLRFGLGRSDLLTLDPAQVTAGVVAGQLLPNLFSSLVQFDEDLGLVPDLAEDWEVSEDGLQYTFKLRQGLTFHNGASLTAEDILYTYDRTTDPEFASPHANKLSLVNQISAADELTVAIEMTEPYAPFLATACSRGPGRALTPVPRNAIEELGDEQFGLTPVGSGPFRMLPQTREGGTGFEMVAFEEWYGGRPFLDKVVVQLIPEPSTQLNALAAGDIDMLGIVPATGVEQVQQNDEITMVDAPGTNWSGLTMNYARPLWDNMAARMAVSKAINRQEFIDKAFLGLAVPSVGPLAPAFNWVYRPPEEVDNPQAYDLDQAKQLAEDAELAGAQPVLISDAGDPRAAEVLRNILSEIGLDVQIDQLQNAAWSERWLAGDYDMLINASWVDVDPDDGVWNFFHSEGPWNSYGYKSAEADELLEGARRTTDQEERRQIYQELQTMLQRDVAYVFLSHLPDRTAFYNDVKGYVPVPEQRYLEHVWLDR